jgi:hypothetical protein
MLFYNFLLRNYLTHHRFYLDDIYVTPLNPLHHILLLEDGSKQILENGFLCNTSPVHICMQQCAINAGSHVAMKVWVVHNIK